MRGSHRHEGTILTKAGLMTVVVGTMLLMAWALFPTAAVANQNVTTPWTGNGSNNLPCNGTTLWILTGFGNQDDEVVGNPVLTISGAGSFTMSRQGNHWRVFVNSNLSAGISASAAWVWDESDNSRPTPVLTISHCTPGTTTTTTTTTTGTTTSGTTTTTGTTTSGTTTTTTTGTTGTTTSGTTTTTGTTGTTTSGTTTSETETSSSTSVQPTTITPTNGTPPSETSVQPTTVTPGGGTAFTGLENLIPLGTIALALMATGSGLMWAGTRRSRKDEEE